jgi:hypothetical protein
MTRRSIARRARAIALVLAVLDCASAAAEERRRHPLLPDQAKLQFAGAIGLVSAGTGYAFARRRVELDLFLGWVPESLADAHLVALTGKLTWLPWSARLARDWRLRPFTAGLAVSYWLNDRFFLRNPDRYPSGYYPVPTALRATVAVGGTIGRSIGPFSELALYWELVAVDVPLAFWIQNRRTVSATDVISLALGVRGEL